MEEIRIAAGYFYLSGFDLIKDDFKNFRDPDDFEHAPLRIMMGQHTNRPTAHEISKGQNLHDQFFADIETLNNAQLGRLERLRDFIADRLVDIRVRNPEEGYFHAKGASFQSVPEDESHREDEVDNDGLRRRLLEQRAEHNDLVRYADVECEQAELDRLH
jgi:hypothetical protein